MGTYLSTPVTEKGEEYGETSQLAWGVVDMQGWRKNMEDAHVAQTDVEVPVHLFSTDEQNGEEQQQQQQGKVFGVFDGHGGPEVARFCQLYMVSVLTQQPTWQNEPSSDNNGGELSTSDPANTPVGSALIQAFHAMDRLINDPLRRDEIIRLRGEKPKPGEHRTATYVPYAYSEEYETSTDGGYDTYRSISHSPVPIEEPTIVAKVAAGVAVLPVANNIKDETAAVDFITPSEVSPEVNEQENGIAISEEPNNNSSEPNNNGDKTLETETSQEPPSGITTETSEELIATVISAEDSNNVDKATEDEPAAPSTLHDGPDAESDITTNPSPPNTDTENRESKLSSKADESTNVEATTEAPPAAAPEPTTETLEEAVPAQDAGDLENNQQQEVVGDYENDGDTKEDDDSNEAVGKEEAAELDQDMMDGDNTATSSETDTDNSLSITKEDPSLSPRGKVTVMFQKLLSISGQVVVNVVRDKGTESDSESDSSQTPADSIIPAQSTPNAMIGTMGRPSAATPTIIHNGRQICNLPDHPIHAGCTAVVAVLIGRTLTVANAGDSRAVLCRAGGRAEALSFDHKPLQEREMRRITNAGGFVNQFGRVNGNLNLSRSIGDLKYKQVPGIHPAGQVITAEPDIVQVTLDPMDEFFILGCDGIWDCLTNEQAVAYVRDRIDTKTPTQIGVEMLDEIISEDPRASQGIGGDNMTVMIVDLLPHTRSHRAASKPS